MLTNPSPAAEPWRELELTYGTQDDVDVAALTARSQPFCRGSRCGGGGVRPSRTAPPASSWVERRSDRGVERQPRRWPFMRSTPRSRQAFVAAPGFVLGVSGVRPLCDSRCSPSAVRHVSTAGNWWVGRFVKRP